jgi:glutathione S-transferase
MDRYDPENTTGFLGKTAEEKSQVMTWLFFQASGQGPYYGQGNVILVPDPNSG